MIPLFTQKKVKVGTDKLIYKYEGKGLRKFILERLTFISGTGDRLEFWKAK